MPETRQEAAVPRHELTGPTYQELGHRDTIDWHYHDLQQLVYPSSGVLAISTARGTWIVPPQRAVWIPGRVAHAHQAHGPTQMRTLIFPASVDPLGLDSPAVLTVSGLLREIIVELTSSVDPAYTACQRADLERVALDQVRRVGQLPVLLPALADDRLRAIAEFFRKNPADDRTLAEFGAAVGASERTLSRLFRQEAGMSFPQWRTQFRLLHALVLLATGTSVTSTALACGWSNPSAFIEAFHHAFGSTPGRFFTS
jgi:AraC-like DNA-binding protein